MARDRKIRERTVWIGYAMHSERLRQYVSAEMIIDTSEMRVILREKNRCEYCGNKAYGVMSSPEIVDNELMCEECYDVKYRTTCELCEEILHNENFKKYNYFTAKMIKNNSLYGMVPGIYEVIDSPTHRSCIVFGFDGLYNDSYRLIRAIDLDIIKDTELYTADTICDTCAEYYAKASLMQLTNEYRNTNVRRYHAKINKVINMRAEVMKAFPDIHAKKRVKTADGQWASTGDTVLIHYDPYVISEINFDYVLGEMGFKTDPSEEYNERGNKIKTIISRRKQ